MRRSFALAGFAAAGLVFLAATVPMRWLGELDAWRSAGLSASGATGTIWNGRLLGLASGAHPLGDVEAGLSAAALLGGTAAIEFSGEAGRGTLLLGRQRGLRAATGQWPLALQAGGATLPALLTLQDASVVFRSGACREATGRVEATLELPAAIAQPSRMVLSGSPACREGIVEATLLPAAGSPPVELLVQARADGHYRLGWIARAPDPSLQAALALAGFTPSPEGYARVDEGQLGARAAAQE